MSVVRVCVVPWEVADAAVEDIGWDRPLFDVVDSVALLRERFVAWAHVNGVGHLVGSLDTIMSTPPPSGLAILVDAPTQLMMLARWPWCRDQLPIERPDPRRG